MKNIKFVKIPLDLSDAECSIPTSNGEYINAPAIFGALEQPTLVDTENKEIPATKNKETETSLLIMEMLPLLKILVWNQRHQAPALVLASSPHHTKYFLEPLHITRF
ncbi:hypothetical protein CAEBREN_16648 [Caenorhabditis brenneri]|uniref:Uncharacterized protein n=1 Tax=Caenorhabditis brenneri TaxID=135651 RepID=G0P0N2_CAEBE|nr:hypothetical protein CAEBREN_16648 [Caenorhabditis brenneri]